ncbi:MAG: acyl-CoA thioesterase [Bryobacteraceae bacterium]|nr:acyl-CoA thioesterase [Bryobacteraceae bacterium]MDW8380414.1 thioesterase family protein [Bryobacterales bacterium]
MQKTYRWRTRVRFVDTDASGRIHYTAMFRYFEAAEQEFLRALGVSFSADPYRDLGFPRVHVECDFSAPVRFDDEVEIEVSVARVGASSFTLAFVASVMDRPAAKGKVTIVCVDKDTQRSSPVPEHLAAALRAYAI